MKRMPNEKVVYAVNVVNACGCVYAGDIKHWIPVKTFLTF